MEIRKLIRSSNQPVIWQSFTKSVFVFATAFIGLPWADHRPFDSIVYIFQCTRLLRKLFRDCSKSKWLSVIANGSNWNKLQPGVFKAENKSIMFHLNNDWQHKGLVRNRLKKLPTLIPLLLSLSCEAMKEVSFFDINNLLAINLAKQRRILGCLACRCPVHLAKKHQPKAQPSHPELSYPVPKKRERSSHRLQLLLASILHSLTGCEQWAVARYKNRKLL